MTNCSASYIFGYLDTPQFLIFALHSIAIFAFPIYIFTGYLILFKTPLAMKSVKFSLLIFHFWTCLVDTVFTVLVSPFPLAPIYAGYPLGVLQWMGVGVQHQALFAMASTEAMMVSVMGLYENRFFILTQDIQWWGRIRIPFYIFNYFLALLAFTPIYYLIPDQTNAKEIILERLPCLSSEILTGGKLFLIAEDASLMLRSASFVSSIICFQGFVFLMLTLKSLNQYRIQLSKKTVEMQRKFLKSILIQLLGPSVFLLFPFSYLWYSARFFYYNQKFTNFSVIFIASHGLFSSIFMVFIQVSYRNVIFDVLFSILRIVGFKGAGIYPADEKSIFQSRMSRNLNF